MSTQRFQTLGTFGKGCHGSLQLSVATSAGPYCDKRCNNRVHCYGARVESLPQRGPLHRKLLRLEQRPPDEIFRAALAELPISTPWLRICSFGSLPGRPTKELRLAIIALDAAALRNRIPVHLSLETAAKATTYRAITAHITVRETVQAKHRWLDATTPVAVVAGTPRQTPLQRLNTAHLVAKQRQEATGRTVEVCPHTSAKIRAVFDLEPFKCGNCTACVDHNRDIVYPLTLR